MDDAPGVAVAHGGQDLRKDPACLRLCHPPVFDHVVEDLPVGGVLGDDVDHGLGLHHLVEADDGRVGEAAHDLDLAENLALVLLVQVRLVHDLDGHLGAGQLVHAQAHQGEVALAQDLLQVVEADAQEALGAAGALHGGDGAPGGGPRQGRGHPEGGGALPPGSHGRAILIHGMGGGGEAKDALKPLWRGPV